MAETMQKEMAKDIRLIKRAVISMKGEIEYIKDRFQDRLLSAEDKKTLDEALEAERKGKLKGMDEVFA